MLVYMGSFAAESGKKTLVYSAYLEKNGDFSDIPQSDMDLSKEIDI